LHPQRIVNKTNGITFRRWLFQSNPGLTRLLRATCGEGVVDDTAAMANLAALADDAAVQQRLGEIKRANKVALSRTIRERTGISVDPDALFDVQVKRMHEYKRQLLNLLETVALYQAIRAEPSRNWVPRVKIFAGKAAASYHRAKLIIKLINDVARTVNEDPAVNDLLKVVFLPNYNVSLAEVIMPAAELSEQISTAGMEASGTGNMKLSLNGALTIGTLDGANIEIQEHVGNDNIFIFGLRANEVDEHRRRGLDASATIAASTQLGEVLSAIESGQFSPDEPNLLVPITQALRHSDYYLVCADFDSYVAAQRQVDQLWLTSSAWARASLLNIARMGWFSSDRTIGEYASEIWNVPTGAKKSTSPSRPVV
jgi:starch phosphorylase